MAHALLPQLHALLNNIGQQKTVDDTGKVSYIPVQIFSDEDLEIFLGLAEKATQSSLKTQSYVVMTNPDLVVEYACYLALMSRSLLEKGRE